MLLRRRPVFGVAREIKRDIEIKKKCVTLTPQKEALKIDV
jgi:hypothetical protein